MASTPTPGNRPLFHRFGWIALAILLPLAIAGWFRLRLESDILSTLPASMPEVQSLKTLRDNFDGGSDLLIAITADTAEESESAAKTVATSLRNKPDFVRDVQGGHAIEQSFGSGPAVVAWALQQASPDKVRAFCENLQGDGAEQKARASLEQVATAFEGESMARIAYDPLAMLDVLDLKDSSEMETMFPGLQSEDGTMQVLAVSPKNKISDYRSAEAWLQVIQQRIREATAGQNVHIRYTGEPAFQAEIGSGIEKDMSGTIGFTEILIGLLFWIMFRMLKPLLWIQFLLILSLGISLGLGGLWIGKLSVMSLGFAAIVLGIITDYAVLIIQDAREHPGITAASLRKHSAPGLIAGACTTATVFLSLLFTGLPGLMELGLLVALGVIVGLGVMLSLAPVFVTKGKPTIINLTTKRQPGHWQGIIGTVALVLTCTAAFLWRGIPDVATNSDALRPTRSNALDDWRFIQTGIGKNQESAVPLLLRGRPEEIRARAETMAATLQETTKEGITTRGSLPVMLAPNPIAQPANRLLLQQLLANQSSIEAAVLRAGFSEDALVLFRGVTKALRSDFEHPLPLASSQAAAHPILNRLLSFDSSTGDVVLLGSTGVSGKPDEPSPTKLDALRKRMASHPGSSLSNWESLGSALSERMQREISRQILPIVGLLLLTLALTFRNVRDVFLSLVLLGGGIAALAATMSLLGISWNLASLAAIPLLLGTGLDYVVHILLALKRTGNDIAHVRLTTGRAVFFSGMTTVIAFASLFFAGNRGVASLGMACCVGTVWILVLTLGLLPHWRKWLSRV